MEGPVYKNYRTYILFWAKTDIYIQEMFQLVCLIKMVTYYFWNKIIILDTEGLIFYYHKQLYFKQSKFAKTMVATKKSNSGALLI